nr:protein UL79 [Equid gammaherpesvirus 5]UTK45585.1 protein UL79 [Equid gammaherpesvirus 5]UTK45664.1 protein UL79 [Equid gammaherpesvirus 5]UTK45743.1 protein UL79 [Equid gammaherpesvirus 5]
MFGKYVSRGERPMSAGVRGLMWRVLSGTRLNNYGPEELRFVHLILCKMYNYALNVLLFRETLTNCACRDDCVLARKVPPEMWKLIYDGCREMGVTEETLGEERRRAELWLHFNANPRLLEGLTNYVTHRLGVTHHVTVCANNLTDGNYLYNLGSVLPSRVLMSIAYCLVYWGEQECEPWVRHFSSRVFVLYLLAAGYLRLDGSFADASAACGYEGLVEMVMRDMRGFRGVAGPEPPRAEAPPTDTLDYLFIFNNNILF